MKEVTTSRTSFLCNTQKRSENRPAWHGAMKSGEGERNCVDVFTGIGQEVHRGAGHSHVHNANASEQ